MKEKLKNKKVVYAIIGIVSVLLVALAVTYAYWLVTKIQTGENEITSGCLDITISGEKNDIELTNQFPMSDEDGMKLVPYEFTVTNNCNTSVDYQVALEATGTESSSMATSSIKVALNDEVMLLGSRGEVETTISGAYESRSIGYGTLAVSGNEGSSATYSLRIWIDADAPISEMNKTFTSKISVTIGQGIESPYEEGTLANKILHKVGGPNSVKEINSELQDVVISSGGVWMSTSSNYYYGTEYTINEETKEYKLSGDLVQATLSECRNGTKTCGKYTLRNTSSTYESTTLYEVTDWDSEEGTSYITANTIRYTNEFAIGTTSSDAGLYKTQDDLGDSYYFRGAPTNNYVEFGSYSSDLTTVFGSYSEEYYTSYKVYKTIEECNNASSYNYDCREYKYASAGQTMYWRIVRINGDGTVRLVYDGTTKSANGVDHECSIGETKFNINKDNDKYVGYTYNTSETDGTQVDSTIKEAVDAWYDEYLETTYGEFIADGLFCNDRSVSGYSTGDGFTTTKPSFGGFSIIYGANQRIKTNQNPSLKCINKEDRYTVDDIENGNGMLSNPVALLTADEAIFAGHAYGMVNVNCYLFTKSKSTWAYLSPYEGVSGNPSIFAISETGVGFAYNNLNREYNIRPVINLKADVKFTGDGTIDSPYKIVTE